MNRDDRVTDLLEYMKRFFLVPVELEMILQDNRYPADIVTRAAIRYAEECSDEDDEGTETGTGTCLSEGLPSIISLLLSYGLEPNAVYNDDDGWGDRNIMEAVCGVDTGFAAADTLALLLEHGGDPNLVLDGEPLFEQVDFDVIFGAAEQGNRQRYAALVHCWLVLIGYGGKLSDGKLPLDVFPKYDSDEEFNCSELREHRNYTFCLSHVPGRGEAWSMHIFDRRTLWEIARL